MQSLELKVPPVAVTIILAAAMFGVSKVVPATNFVIPGSTSIALGCALCSGVIVISGVIAFRTSKTTVNPLDPGAASTIVSNGIYRYSRNPMYLGFLLTLAAWAVYLSNVVAALFLPVFVAYMNRFQIQPEERILLGKFGPAFSQYLAAVRRWV